MKNRRAFLGLVLLSTPLALAALQSGDFVYSSDRSGVTITGYTGAGGAVIIPGVIDNLPVISLGDFAFANNLSLTGVIIPGSVTNIGNWAFYGCPNLAGVTIPGGVTVIGESAFSHCFSLPGVIIPAGVITIGTQAFSCCYSLATIAVDAANPSYSSAAGVLFNKSQTKLIQCPGGASGSYVIPGTVTTIGGHAFEDCPYVASVTIPDSVTSIESRAFKFCTSLTGIMVPAGVAAIGDRAFARCINLADISVNPSNIFYSSVNGVLFNKNQTVLMQCPGGKSGGYAIPGSVTAVGPWACYGCVSLTNLTIPGSVAVLGESAFEDCPGLTGVVIPASVTGIGNKAFYGCTDLTAIAVDAANPSYSSAAGVLFNKSQTKLIQCPGGKGGSYTVPAGVASIEDGAFACCPSLNSIIIPGSVTNIGNKAFSVCSSLASLFFYGNAPSIGINVFSPASQTVVYYLLGTTGWGATYAGRPAVPWNGQLDSLVVPLIMANGFTNDIVITSGSSLSIAVQLNPGQYHGASVDWWVLGLAGSSWFYLDHACLWQGFDGNLSHCHPAYMGPLVSLPATEVLHVTGLPVGSYTFWFGVDYPVDGVLNYPAGLVLCDLITVIVQ